MQRLISALRRSLNGGNKERISNSANSNQMEVEGNAIGSMEGSEHPDGDSGDGFYEALHNVFPSSSPHNIYCSDSQENIPFQSEMADLGEPSSSHENLEFFSGKEESGDSVDTSAQETSSKKIQACTMQTVAVQCEPIMCVSKGVQWEPLLMVSRSVQCVPWTPMVNEVQCSNSFKTQCEQSETVSLVTTGVQYEDPHGEEESEEKESNTSKQLSEKVSVEESGCVDGESDTHSISQLNGSEDQQVLSFRADLSITLPSVQEEIDVENSSQTTINVVSASSPENVSMVELSSFQPVPSTSGVKGVRKRKCANRVRKMRSRSGSSENSHKKCSKKSLPVKSRTDRNRSLTECVNSDDSDTLESESVLIKQANNSQKVFYSPSKETRILGKSDGEKLVVEESSEELLEQMGNYENCLAKEDISNKKNGAISIKDKQQQTFSQKTVNSSCSQSDTTRDVAATSESQRTGGLNWFSSLACERFSSPESIGEDMFEELKEDRSNCNKNLAHKVQSKFTKNFNEHFSFRNTQHSHRQESCTVKKSIVQNLVEDSHKPPVKRKKLAIDANDNINVSSKNNAQLVPYSDSDSGPESSSVDHFNESGKEVSKHILKKQQCCKTTSTNNKLQKTGTIPSQSRKQKACQRNNCDRVSKPQFRSSRSNSESGSEKNSPAHSDICISRSESENSEESLSVFRKRLRRVQRKKVNVSSPGSESSERENSEESDVVPRRKFRRIQENKLNLSAQQNSRTRTKSGNVSVHSSNAGNKCSSYQRENTSPVHISIWSSDEEGNCSRVSTVTCRSKGSKGSLRRGAPYMKEEREAILWYIIDHKLYKLVKGKAMWERMEREQVCIDRSWQSMKEHFLKKILPQIETFNLSSEITKRLVSVRK